jgi:Tol biopolymer transport system component
MRAHRPSDVVNPRLGRRIAALVGCALLTFAIAGAAPAFAAGTERVSVRSDGGQGTDDSLAPSVSADGRYVAFASDADNLVAADTNNSEDVFVRDRQTGSTELISVDSNELAGDSDSYLPSISADGRYVAFASDADNLVAGDTNGSADIFVRDRQTGTTERVSLTSAGAQDDSDSERPVITPDGRYVAFGSYADDLVAGDTNDLEDVFVRDRTSGTTERVSLTSSEIEGDGDSQDPSISADGRFVAFDSFANNLVPDDGNVSRDVFVRDRTAGTTERVSLRSDGSEADDDSYEPSISADGRYVAFGSASFNLVDDDTNDVEDVFVRDRTAGTTQRVSVNTDGSEGDDDSFGEEISADGRYVVFDSGASTLVDDDTNGSDDVFVHDRTSGATERVSLASDGSQSDDDSDTDSNPAISADGRYVAFSSAADNLVGGDTNGSSDVFLRDRGAVVGPYAQQVLAAVPAGYWRFGEASGTTALDSSGNANNGTYLNGPLLGLPGALAGDANTAASFDGVNDSVRVPDANSLDVGDSFTLEGWIKRSSATKAYELFNKGGNGLQLTVMSAANGNQVWLRKANVSTIARSSAGVPADGRFHYVVATKNGPNSAHIYIDGVESTVAVSPAQVIANTAFPLTFTGAGTNQHTLDEFALYDGVLTPAQIMAHYQAGVGGGI